MADADSASTSTSRVIEASCNALYRAFLDPAALVSWLPPGEMTGRIHSFDGRTGGGYEMSLFYPVSEQPRGKTAEREDRVTVRFLELTPPEKIVEAVRFHSPDPALAQEMTFEATFIALGSAAKVTIVCTNIPPGIRPEDNDAGCRQSLEKLAHYLE